MNKIEKLFKSSDLEIKKGNFDKAIEMFNEIIDLGENEEKNDYAVHMACWGAGDIYLNNKQYDKAEFYFKKAIQKAPKDHRYHYLLGCTYTYLNKIAEAIIHLERAVELDDSVDIYWGQLGWVVGYNRDSTKGIEYLKKSLNLNPRNTHSLEDICMLYTKEHLFNEALVCIEEAEKHSPEDEEIMRLKNNIENFKSEFERLSK